MPATRIILFCDDRGSAPLIDWLQRLPARVVAKCRVALGQLAERGHELRRPHADYLRDGVYELRIRFMNVQYRILYFFHGDRAVVVSHGTTKLGAVPKREIDLCVARKRSFEADPAMHTYEGTM